MNLLWKFDNYTLWLTFVSFFIAVQQYSQVPKFLVRVPVQDLVLKVKVQVPVVQVQILVQVPMAQMVTNQVTGKPTR